MKIPKKYVQKIHSKDQIIRGKNKGVRTRRRLVETSEQTNLYFLSKIEPNNFAKASKDDGWMKGMEGELNKI